MNLAEVKVQLIHLLKEQANARVASSKKALNEARESANHDTKSTMGDKHETGRVMAQLEIEKHGQVLADAEKQVRFLSGIDAYQHCKHVQLGALVITSQLNVLISISAGKLEFNGQIYYCISPISPLAKALLTRKENDKVSFQEKEFIIQHVQ